YEEGILAAGGRPFLHRRDLAPLVPSMLRLGAVRSVEHFVHRFFREPHVRQAFAFHPLFIGGDPFRVPAVYAALAYLQIDEGVWYVEGGMHELVLALSRVVERRGAIRLGEGVRRIQTEGGRVRGVVTSAGEFLPAEVVVSNADVVATQRELLGRRELVPSRLSMSCYLLHLGLETRYPQLAHHTLLVGEDYPGFVRDVTRRGRLGGSPSLYLHSPTASDPKMAPPGGDSLTVLLPVPNLSSRQVEWARDGAEVRESVLTALESSTGLGLEGIRERVRLERAWTPLDFQQALGAVEGNAFGPEPVLLQSASFRQPNRDRRIEGLYYVGAGTHPGAGIPGVLMGAAITARLVVDG
ncbi:MAG: phytoene desaturase family protein, partial [Candidatus Dormibacteria bacterium]